MYSKKMDFLREKLIVIEPTGHHKMSGKKFWRISCIDKASDYRILCFSRKNAKTLADLSDISISPKTKIRAKSIRFLRYSAITCDYKNFAITFSPTQYIYDDWTWYYFLLESSVLLDAWWRDSTVYNPCHGTATALVVQNGIFQSPTIDLSATRHNLFSRCRQ